MTCPICHSSPADMLWHGVLICTPCREGQRTVDRRLNWILLGCAAIFIACIISIAARS